MKQVLTRIKNYLPQATQAEEQVIRIMAQNPREVLTMQTSELAKAGYCSPATVIRLCQKLGFRGLKELKLAISEELGYAAANNTSSFDASLPMKKVVADIVELYQKTMSQIQTLVDYTEVEKAASLIHKSSLVHLFGMGASYLVAEDFMMKLARVKKVGCLYHDIHLQLVDAVIQTADLQLVDAGNVGVDEVCLIISYSGQTREVLKAAQEIRQNGGIIISLTQYSDNQLARMADCRLYVPATEEALRISAGSSRISQLVMIDILFSRILAMDYESSMVRIVDSQHILPKLPMEERPDRAELPLENDLEETGKQMTSPDEPALEDDLHSLEQKME